MGDKFKKISFFLLLFILTPVFVFSQEIQYPPVPGPGGKVGPGTTFTTYVGYLFNLAIISGGIIALAVIIWAGFIYFSSATSGEKKAEAKKKIISAFLGLIILLGAYVILATINPQLLILSLQPVSPPAPSTPPGPTTPTTTFQEIPLGTLIENILGKNISCFDKDRNLIDCQESECFATTTGYICKDGIQFQGSVSTTFASKYPKIASTSLIFVPDTDFRYCYTYDSNGNKKGLLEYKDQYECIRNLLPALKVKSEQLRDLIGKLKHLAEELKDLSAELDTKAKKLRDDASTLNNYVQNNCQCSNCRVSGDSSGCGDCDCVCSGPPSGCCCSDDPCSQRKAMDTLRDTTLPNDINDIICTASTCIIPRILEKEKEINKKRDEIRGFIFGAASSTDKWYYATSMDPYATSTFLTFDEGRERLESFLDELYQDLDDLQEAENRMKSPYGDRLSFIEFLNLKEKDPREVLVDKLHRFEDSVFIKSYQIDKYCYEFNCTHTTPEGVCDKCATSTEGRMCRIKVEAGTSSELYVFHGDPATFYYHDEYNEERVLTKEKCTIDKEEKEGFYAGLIPVGQTVDETEDFANAVISQVQGFYNEIDNIQTQAVNAREKAFGEIVAVQNQIKEITGDKYGVYDEDDSPRNTNISTTTIDKVGTTTPFEIYYIGDGSDNLLKDLTSPGSDNTADCVDDCSIVCTSPCTSEAGTDTGGNGSCGSDCCDCDCETDDEGDTHCSCEEVTYYCTCQTCTGTVCPYDRIQSLYDYLNKYYTDAYNFYQSAVSHYDNIVTSYDSIVNSIGRLQGYFSGFTGPSYYNKFVDLILATNLKAGDPNRCTILHKLTNSRKKLQKYFTGYGFALKEGKVKKRIFSSKIGLDLYHGRKLVILPDRFFYPIGGNSINAYPYNSSKLTSGPSGQQKQCHDNRVSTACWEAINVINNLLEDYYCCETVP